MDLRFHNALRRRAPIPTFALIFTLTSFALAPAPAADQSDAETAYLAETRAAMTKMMNDMAVNPTGDVDRDFVAMMIPHHQGAIAMAQAVLRHGRNEQIKRLAQEIIVTQQQEIVVMRLAIGEPLPSESSAARPSPARPHEHEAMPAAR